MTVFFFSVESKSSIDHSDVGDGAFHGSGRGVQQRVQQERIHVGRQRPQRTWKRSPGNPLSFCLINHINEFIMNCIRQLEAAISSQLEVNLTLEQDRMEGVDDSEWVIDITDTQASLIWGEKLNMVFFPIFSFRNSPYLAFFIPFSRFFSHPFVIITSIVTGFRAVIEQF